MLVCGQYNQYVTDLPRVCSQPTPKTLWLSSERGWKWAAKARAINHGRLPAAVIPQSPMTASWPDRLLHRARPAASSWQTGLLAPQEKASLLVSQIPGIIPLTHKYSASCGLSNIAFDYSNIEQLDSICQRTTKLRSLLLVQWENISLDEMDKWLASYSMRNFLLTSHHILRTYLSSDKKYYSSLYKNPCQ